MELFHCQFNLNYNQIIIWQVYWYRDYVSWIYIIGINR